MVFFRGLGWLLLLAAVAVGVYEVADYIDRGDQALSAAGELWFRLHASSLNLMQALVQRYIHEDVWNDLVRPVLLQPGLFVLGGAALFCLVIGYVFRRRRPEPAGRRRRRR